MNHILYLLFFSAFFLNDGASNSGGYELLKRENGRLRRAVDSINLFSALDVLELSRSQGSVSSCPSVAQIAFFDSLVIGTRAHRFALDTLKLNLNECRKQ